MRRAFLLRQKPPAQRLILHVVLAQREGRYRLGHLVTQVKSVRRIYALLFAHLCEERERITALQEHLVVENVQKTAFSEQAEIAIRNARCQFGEHAFAVRIIPSPREGVARRGAAWVAGSDAGE